MNPQTLPPASAAANTSVPTADKGAGETDTPVPADLIELPVAPRWGGWVREFREQNQGRYAKAKASGATMFWREIYLGGVRYRQCLHILEGEAKYEPERMAWDQAHIADDGTAQVHHRGEWHEWTPPARDRRPAGHAPRQAANARTRGSRRRVTRSSSRSGDSGDGEPGESEPRYCLCDCGADLTGRRPQTLYDTGGCEAKYRRGRKAELERLAGLSDAERDVIWQRFGGGDILLELFIGAVALSELLVPDASGPASKRVRQTVAA